MFKKRFNVSLSLNRHMLTHTGEKPHQCPHCSKGFTQKWDMKSHIPTHNWIKVYISPCRLRLFSWEVILEKLTHGIIGIQKCESLCEIQTLLFLYILTFHETFYFKMLPIFREFACPNSLISGMNSFFFTPKCFVILNKC